MSQQTLDVRGFLQTVRQYRKVVLVAAGIGLVVGALFTVLRPPMLSSKVLVVLPPSASRFIATQMVIASSDPVLSEALPSVDKSWSITTLRSRVQVTSPTSALIQISAYGTSAAQAQDIASAVANSYVSYVASTNSPARVGARVLERATPASGTSLPVRLLLTGVLGALIGALVGAIVALAVSRRERRLRQRDDIADAIGVPVLASIPVGHPSDSAGWTRLLSDYDPKPVHAWGLRKAMQRLGLADLKGGGSTSVAVLSLSSDPGALAIGPQLAAFAATLEIPTLLVIGHQQDANTTAMLSTACSATPVLPGRSGLLRLAAGDQAGSDGTPTALTVIVAVVQRPGPAGGRHHPRGHDGARRLGGRGDRRPARPGRGQRRRRRARYRRDHRRGPRRSGPHDRPSSTAGPPGAAAADPPDQHYGNQDDGDPAVTLSRFAGNGLREGAWADDSEVARERPAERAGGLASLAFLGAALRRRAWVWCLMAVLGLLAALALKEVLPPAYQASTTILMVYTADENPADAILTDIALAQSRAVADGAMRELGVRESVRSFQAAYSVAQITDRVIDIVVSAPTTSEAVARARVLATVFLQLRAHELQTQQQLALVGINQQIKLYKQQIAALNRQIAKFSGSAASPAATGSSATPAPSATPAASATPTPPLSRAQKARLASLQTRRNRLEETLTGTEQAASGYPVGTASMVHGSQVLDAAAPVHRSKFRLMGLYAIGGLVAGLMLGLGIVIVQALVSNRLRRRDDIARALGAPVNLSLGSLRAGRRWRGRRGGGLDAHRLVAYLRRAVPTRSSGAAALAVVAVDNAGDVAPSLVALAVSCAQEGKEVVLADLADGAPVARLLRPGTPGIDAVTVNGVRLVLAVPAAGTAAPAGPLPQAQPGTVGMPGTPVEVPPAVYASADVLLTLVSLDPAVGADYLPSWASGAVVVVTAGRSTWARIRAVGEMIRAAGTPLVAAVLTGTDKGDESLGATYTAPYQRRPARMGAVR